MYRTDMTDDEKEKIIKEFQPFIKYTALRLRNKLPAQLTLDDLISVGIIGLLDAMDNYDPARAKLKTYAEFRIKGAMLDEIRAFDPAPRSLKEKVNDIKAVYNKLESCLGRTPEDVEIADELNMSIDDYYKILKDANGVITLRFEDFSSRINDMEDINLMDNIPDPSAHDPLKAMLEASQKETLAAVIDKLPEKEKTILSLYYWEELTMKEIAAIMSLSEGRVSQLHSQAILRLKSKLSYMSIT
ncbi:MAG: FliA/WhiG family RNA polymerase sigma factor [Candidatus Magnetoovum sp. WYHC-5]|nr:FliA/WhiG family RNA polymerase sigma factor [Candidatus Magnetoovum sp. WYHC-5]